MLMTSTKVEMSFNRIARLKDSADLAELLFPGNRNQQHAFLAVWLALKWADHRMVPNLEAVADEQGISRRTAQRVRAKMRRLGLIDRVSRFNASYGGREGWVLSGRFERSLRELADRVSGFKEIHHIDEPIDRVVTDFCRQPEPHFSRQRFHQVLTLFVAHLFARGLSCPRRLTTAQAHDEAIALLEQDYRGTRANGYLAAVLDAAQAGPGWMDLVLARLAEAIKARWRHMHARWVYARFLDPLDGELRCAIAASLLARYGPRLPDPLTTGSGSQFADEIPALLSDGLNVDRQLDQISAGFGWVKA